MLGLRLLRFHWQDKDGRRNVGPALNRPENFTAEDWRHLTGKRKLTRVAVVVVEDDERQMEYHFSEPDVENHREGYGHELREEFSA